LELYGVYWGKRRYMASGNIVDGRIFPRLNAFPLGKGRPLLYKKIRHNIIYKKKTTLYDINREGMKQFDGTII
jgi:hypothetical protein